MKHLRITGLIGAVAATAILASAADAAPVVTEATGPERGLDPGRRRSVPKRPRNQQCRRPAGRERSAPDQLGRRSRCAVGAIVHARGAISQPRGAVLMPGWFEVSGRR